MIDERVQAELRAKFNPDGSDLRKAQLRMLTLLRFLDKICKEYNLEYWLDSGTLLGAARHGGFIPWDDDIDVCMMKKDAEHLKNIMGDKIWQEHIVLQTHETDPNYFHPSWITLRDIKSEYITDNYYHNIIKYKGLQIDIFIIEENIPANLLKLSSKLFNFMVIAPLMGRHRLTCLRPIVPINYSILNRFVFPILKKIHKKSDTVSSGLGADFLKIQKKDDIFPLRKIFIEGYEFSCPSNYDAYLTQLYKKYGSWTTIPSLNKIRTHGVKFRFLE